MYSFFSVNMGGGRNPIYKVNTEYRKTLYFNSASCCEGWRGWLFIASLVFRHSPSERVFKPLGLSLENSNICLVKGGCNRKNSIYCKLHSYQGNRVSSPCWHPCGSHRDNSSLPILAQVLTDEENPFTEHFQQME